MKNKLLLVWKENKTFLVFLLLMFMFRSAIADWNDIPSGSMKPTILEGDRVFINKLAYDVRMPFTQTRLKKLSDPVRGDIIVFESKVSEKRLIKRVVGVPGDTVSMVDNIVFVNGRRLSYQTITSSVASEDKIEDLLGVKHKVRINRNGSAASSFLPQTVPDGYYLAMGDNRDNSADSRVIGFIPRSEIIGRSQHVVLSLDYDNYLIPRTERFFKAI